MARYLHVHQEQRELTLTRPFHRFLTIACKMRCKARIFPQEDVHSPVQWFVPGHPYRLAGLTVNTP